MVDQWLGTLASLEEDPGLVPSTPGVPQTSVMPGLGETMATSAFPSITYLWYKMNRHAGKHSHTHEMKINPRFKKENPQKTGQM